MPTVLTLRNIRVVIFTNDHPPPHVHAIKANLAAARFKLNCPGGPVELCDHEGFRRSELNEIAALVAEYLDLVCIKWREIHG